MNITLVYVTPNCQEDAQRYNVPIQKVKNKIISGMSCLERFEDNYYVLKKCNGYDNRFITWKYSPNIEGYDSVDVYILLRILKRGNKDYDTRFSSGNLTQRHAVANFSDIDWKDVDNFVKESLSKPVEAFVEDRQLLSQEEQNYVYNTGIMIGSLEDQMVYESKEWVESIRHQDFTHQLGSICTKLGNFFTLTGQEDFHDGVLLENYVIETIVPIPQTNWYALIYTLPDKDGWFLGNIDKRENLEATKKDAFSFMYTDSRPSREVIIQKTRRVYPLLYLAEDSEFWNEMEKDPWGNYALSGEELRILRPQGENQHSSISFPLFINGRAGSGKSTILQYLFTEFFVSGLDKNVKPTLYLSYSKELIDNAKKMIRSLIIRNVDRKKQMEDILNTRYSSDIDAAAEPDLQGSSLSESEKENKKLDNKLNKVFAESFYSFHDLLFSLIPPKFKKRFPQNKYWNFTNFKLEFNKSNPGQKKYSAAICWHIIRTYIKGWFDDEYCTPAYFNELGEDSVSKETFQWVYTNVWENWYKKKMNEKGVWDDQDLVRFCLNPSSCFDYDCEDTKDLPETFIEPRFSGIFCDESQDFTQVELAAIIGLSIFSNRRISSSAELERIPFVFAGDEFQTLNPTGFSWSSLRKTFTERLIHRINPRLKGADKPFELQNNYRSSRSIVRFSNRVQLLRRILFNKEIGKDIAPQKPWDVTDDTPVLCFSPKDSSVWYKLQEIKAVVIIPCEEGQSKEDYVNHTYNGAISKFISFDENGASTGVTLLTPAQAKGMEYPIVAICGFDNSEVVKIVDKLLSGDNPNTSDAQKIEYKYWINNAYVAITRAKKQLIVLDSIFDEGENKDNFWKYSYQINNHTESEDYTNQFLNLLSNKERQEKWNNPDENLGFMYKGKLDRIGSANRQDILETANSLAENGQRKMDANLMGQAARIYQEIGGEDKKLHSCYGYMYLFKRDFEKAYHEFKSIGEDLLAVESLWLMLGSGRPEKSRWKNSSVCKILKLPENSAIDAVEKDFADLMNFGTIATSFMRKFTDAITRLSKEIKENARERFLTIINNSNPWSWSINVLLSMLLENRKKFSNSWIPDIQNILESLESLIDLNLSIDAAYLADIAFYIAEKTNRKEYYEKCVSLCESKDVKERNRNYYISLSHLKPLEEWFDYLGENSRWESNEQLSKDIFLVLREKRQEISNFDELSLPAKRLYTETFFKHGQEEEGFREYAARIQNATEYEKLASTVRANTNTVQMCQRLKTITMLISYINNWIDKPETRDTVIQGTLINNIETYFRGTAWIKPLKTMLELCNLDLVERLDVATYKKQSKKFCDDNLTYLVKFDQTFFPIVMNVAGCVIEKCERFFSRVLFYEWARDWAKEEYNKKRKNVYSKSIAWFNKRRAVAKYKIAEYDGNKDEIVVATKELEEFNGNPNEVDATEYPDNLFYLYSLVTSMGTNKTPILIMESSRGANKPNGEKGRSETSQNKEQAQSGPSQSGSSSSAASKSESTTVPPTGAASAPVSPVSDEDASKTHPESGASAAGSDEKTPVEQPSEQKKESNGTSAKIDDVSDSDKSRSDDDGAKDSEKTKSETASSNVTDSDEDGKPDGESADKTPVDSAPDIDKSTVPVKRFKAHFRMLTSRSKLTVTLDQLENDETVDVYTGALNLETGEFNSNDLSLVDDRIVLSDGTPTQYSIIRASKNDITISED